MSDVKQLLEEQARSIAATTPDPNRIYFRLKNDPKFAGVSDEDLDAVASSAAMSTRIQKEQEQKEEKQGIFPLPIKRGVDFALGAAAGMPRSPAGAGASILSKLGRHVPAAGLGALNLFGGGSDEEREQRGLLTPTNVSNLVGGVAGAANRLSPGVRAAYEAAPWRTAFGENFGAATGGIMASGGPKKSPTENLDQNFWPLAGVMGTSAVGALLPWAATNRAGVARNTLAAERAAAAAKAQEELVQKGLETSVEKGRGFFSALGKNPRGVADTDQVNLIIKQSASVPRIREEGVSRVSAATQEALAAKTAAEKAALAAKEARAAAESQKGTLSVYEQKASADYGVAKLAAQQAQKEADSAAAIAQEAQKRAQISLTPAAQERAISTSKEAERAARAAAEARNRLEQQEQVLSVSGGLSPAGQKAQAAFNQAQTKVQFAQETADEAVRVAAETEKKAAEIAGMVDKAGGKALKFSIPDKIAAGASPAKAEQLKAGAMAIQTRLADHPQGAVGAVDEILEKVFQPTSKLLPQNEKNAVVKEVLDLTRYAKEVPKLRTMLQQRAAKSLLRHVGSPEAIALSGPGAKAGNVITKTFGGNEDEARNFFNTVYNRPDAYNKVKEFTSALDTVITRAAKQAAKEQPGTKPIDHIGAFREVLDKLSGSTLQRIMLGTGVTGAATLASLRRLAENKDAITPIHLTRLLNQAAVSQTADKK